MTTVIDAPTGTTGRTPVPPGPDHLDLLEAPCRIRDAGGGGRT